MTKIPSYSEAKQVDLSAMPWSAWTEFKGETFLYVRKDNDTFLPLNDIVQVDGMIHLSVKKNMLVVNTSLSPGHIINKYIYSVPVD